MLPQSPKLPGILHAPTHLPVIGSYSAGQTPQWDGLNTPAGFLLRWFVDPARGFPQDGFDVWKVGAEFLPIRARTPLTYIYHLGPVVALEILDPQGALSAAPSKTGQTWPNFVISTSPGQNVLFSFSHATISLGVVIASAQAADGVTALQVSGSLNGKTKTTGSLTTGQTLDWSSYVLDAVTFSGSGYVSVIMVSPLELATQRGRPTHFCLPVVDRAYPCARSVPRGVTGLQIAMSRLPTGMPRSEQIKYRSIYNEMAPTLRRIATGTALQPLPPDPSPNAPTFNTDEGAMVQIALLDPHVAEMLGLMCVIPPDDSPGPVPPGGQPRSQAFIVDARYLNPQLFRFPADRKTFRSDFKATGLSWSGPVTISYDGSVSTGFGQQSPLALNLNPNCQYDLRLIVRHTTPLRFQTLDSTGAIIEAWTTVPASPSRQIGDINVATVQFSAGSSFTIEEIRWEDLDIVQGTCAVDAVEYGAPPAPTWTKARVKPAAGVTGVMQAALDWEVFGDPATGIDLTHPAFYQAVRGELSNDPQASRPIAASTPPKAVTPLSDGNFILVPPSLYGVEPRTLLVDLGDNNSGIPEGWLGYWIRSIDIFGRRSNYGSPAVVRVTDDSLPPPPIIVAAEYIQSNQVPSSVQVSRSVAAKKWLAENPTIDGFSASIGWTPETARACSDVDGFSLSFQLGGANFDPAWQLRPYTQVLLDPNPVTLPGTLTSWAVANNSEFQPTLSRVTSPGSLLKVTGQAAPPVLAVCDTDLSLDAGAGIFSGWTLIASDGSVFPVVTNGTGPKLTITVQCPNATPPALGGYSLAPPNSGTGQDVLVIQTTVAPTPVDPADDQRWRSGGLLLIDNPANPTDPPYRLIVIGSASGTFWCATTGSVLPQQASDVPPPGTNVTWYPVYTVNVPAGPLGMTPTPQTPKTAGQVVARSLRRAGAVHSAPSVPTTVTAFDVTRPDPPTLTGIQTAIDDYCAQLAGPADWYGMSAFPTSPGAPGLTWQPVDGMKYNVYRAFDHAIWLVDVLNGSVHDTANMNTPTLTALQAPSESARLVAVQADFQTLDDTLAPLIAASPPTSSPTGNPSGPATEILAAYDALHADAQQVLAELNISPAQGPSPFTLVTNSPINPPSSPYTFQDTLEGRARTHWFYCIAAVSPTGIQGPYSACTPPICCPNTVPPRKPTLLSALLTGFPAINPGNVVYLTLIGNAETNVASYNIYCLTSEQAAAFDSRFATPFIQLQSGSANWPLQPNVANVVQVTSPAPGKWYFCVTATDGDGNTSGPSAILSARTFPPYPQVPSNFQVTPNPDGSVTATWTIADPQLSCQLQRSTSPTTFWQSVSGWLPRGVQTYNDTPPLPGSYTYQAVGRDVYGQVTVATPAAAVTV